MKAMSVSLMVKYKTHNKRRRATGKLKKIPVKWKVRNKNKGKVSSEVCETSREKSNMNTNYSYSQVNKLVSLLPLLGLINQGKWGGKVYNKLEVLASGCSRQGGACEEYSGGCQEVDGYHG